MSSLSLTPQTQEASDTCWSVLQSKQLLLVAGGHDCSVTRHPEHLEVALRMCLSWVPRIDTRLPGISPRASRTYVLELTLSPNGDLLGSYSGCGIDTRRTRRAVSTGPLLLRELESLCTEFEVASRCIHDEWFVASPNVERTAGDGHST